MKEFGAIGDGVNDDTNAFISALSTTNNIFVPEGIYLIKKTLTLKTKSSIIGKNKEHSILLFEGVDGINFIPQSQNDGYLNIENITIEFKGLPVLNTKGIDFSGVNYSRVDNVYVKYFGTGIFLSRLNDSFGPNGCFFNNLQNINIYYSKIGVDLNDDIGYSVNNNKFSYIHYEGASLYVKNALAFENHIAYRVTGYGNSFYNIYGGGYHGDSTTFMEFGENPIYKQSISGGNTIINPYVESSPTWAFKIPTTTSRRLGNMIINPSFDGRPKTLYYDPMHELTVISTERNDVKDSHFQRIGDTGSANLIYGEDVFIPNACDGASFTITNPQDGISGAIIVRDSGSAGGIFTLKYSGEVQGKNMLTDSNADTLFEYNYIKELNKIFVRKVQ